MTETVEDRMSANGWSNEDLAQPTSYSDSDIGEAASFATVTGRQRHLIIIERINGQWILTELA